LKLNKFYFSHYRKITLHAILLISFCLGIVYGCGSKLAKEKRKIQDPNPSVRYLATGTLADINDTQVVEPLIAALQDNDQTVVSRAIQGLAQIGDKRAIPPLIAALRAENPLVRH
jgi:HEAT repeat protein